MRWPRPGAPARFVVTGVVAAAVSAGYQFGYRRIGFPLPSEVPTVAASLVTIAVLACAAAAVLVRRHGTRRPPAWIIPACGAVLPALLSTAIQSWLLTGTRFYINGLGGDQQFRTAFLTRMTDSPALADAVYADLPPYYSPAWFWTGGRFADLAGIPGWEFYKIWAIATMAVAASLAYVLWARVVRARTALVLALATALTGLHTAAYSPYSWVLIALGPPLAVLALRTIRRVLVQGRMEVWPCVGIGVYVGLASITHALLAALAGVYLVLATAAVLGLRAWRRRERLGGGSAEGGSADGGLPGGGASDGRLPGRGLQGRRLPSRALPARALRGSGVPSRGLRSGEERHGGAGDPVDRPGAGDPVDRPLHVRRFAAGIVVAVASALPIAGIVWVPYLLAPAPLGTDSTAAKFLPESGAHIPTPMFDTTVIGAACAIGFAWAIVRVRRDPAATALSVTAVSVFAWYVLSFLAPLAKSTFLAFRFEPLLVLALVCGGVFGVRDVAALARRRGLPAVRAGAPAAPAAGPGPDGTDIGHVRGRRAERGRAVAAVVAAFAVLAALNVAYYTRTVHHDWNAAAVATPGPDGVVALGTELQDDAGADGGGGTGHGASAGSVKAADGHGGADDADTPPAPPPARDVRDAIAQATGGRSSSSLVVLSDVPTLLSFYPYRGFQAVNSAYANPKAGFDERNDLIRSWGEAPDAAALTGMLDRSPVRAPDVFVLTRGPAGWVYTIEDSLLPREPGDVGEPIAFDPAVFAGPAFTTIEVGTLEIVARR